MPSNHFIFACASPDSEVNPEKVQFLTAASRVIPIGYTPGSKGTIAKLASNAVAAGKNGYVYVYFSNETEEIVSFDNFKLRHKRGRILEEMERRGIRSLLILTTS